VKRYGLTPLLTGEATSICSRTITNGLVKVPTEGSSFDTLLGVYTGTAVNCLTVVAGNDDWLSGWGMSSRFLCPSVALDACPRMLGGPKNGS
jgi:hypothetical protein